jgi:predicted hotdog family 3-hydroxylacyl-ACP dehydratase
LLAYDKALGSGRILVLAKDETIFTDDGGVTANKFLEEVVLLEMMAQAYACLRGYEDRVAGCQPSIGFLVGIRRFTCQRRVETCEEFTVEVATAIQVDDFYIADATVQVGSERVAEAELKFWVPPVSGGSDN